MFITIFFRAKKPEVQAATFGWRVQGGGYGHASGPIVGTLYPGVNEVGFPSSVFRFPKTANGGDGHGDSGPSGLRPVGCGASALVDAGILVASRHAETAVVVGAQS